MKRIFRKNDNIDYIFFLDGSCCSIELNNLFSSKYDLERLGYKRTFDINLADLIFINGFMSAKQSTYLKLLMSEIQISSTKIIAIGGCAINKGPLNNENLDIPIDINILGCPPRPEAIIQGLIKLKTKKVVKD